MKKKKKKVRDHSDSPSLKLINLKKTTEEIAWMLKRTCISGIGEKEYFSRSQHGVHLANMEYLHC